jgi:hypothetical protein
LNVCWIVTIALHSFLLISMLEVLEKQRSKNSDTVAAGLPQQKT